MDYTNVGQVENTIKYRMRETIVSLQQNPVGKSRLTINRNEMKKQVTKRSFYFKSLSSCHLVRASSFFSILVRDPANATHASGCFHQHSHQRGSAWRSRPFISELLVPSARNRLTPQPNRVLISPIGLWCASFLFFFFLSFASGEVTRSLRLTD